MSTYTLSTCEIVLIIICGLFSVIYLVKLIKLFVKHGLPCTSSRRNSPFPVDLEAQNEEMEEESEVVKEVSRDMRASDAIVAHKVAAKANATTVAPSSSKSPIWTPESSQAQMAESAAAVTSPNLKAYQPRVEDVPAADLHFDLMSYTLGRGRIWLPCISNCPER